MKKLLLLVLIVALCVPVCSQTWADGVGGTIGPDDEDIGFTVPSIVMDVIAIIAPHLVSDGRCPGERICGWVFDGEWKWRCICTHGNLR